MGKMSVMQSKKARSDLELSNAEPMSGNDSQAKASETRIYFSPGYTGSVHLILGSFVVETADSVEEALDHAERYSAAAKRCGKAVELVPVDSSYQTSVLTIEEWLLLRIS